MLGASPPVAVEGIHKASRRPPGVCRIAAVVAPYEGRIPANELEALARHVLPELRWGLERRGSLVPAALALQQPVAPMSMPNHFSHSARVTSLYLPERSLRLMAALHLVV